MISRNNISFNSVFNIFSKIEHPTLDGTSPTLPTPFFKFQILNMFKRLIKGFEKRSYLKINCQQATSGSCEIVRSKKIQESLSTNLFSQNRPSTTYIYVYLHYSITNLLLSMKYIKSKQECYEFHEYDSVPALINKSFLASLHCCRIFYFE